MSKFTTSVHDRWILPARAGLTAGQEKRLQLAGKRLPSTVAVRLIVDSGSGRSSLVPPVIEQLKPLSQKPVHVETSAGTVATMLYWVRLEFPHTKLGPFSDIPVAQMPLPPSLKAFLGLIGRDLLRRWEELRFQGRRGRLTIRDRPSLWFGWLL
jgi:hypothetical protein